MSLELKIRPIPGQLRNEIFLFEVPTKLDPHSTYCYLTCENGEMVRHTFPRDRVVKIEPFMVCDEELTRGIVDAFAAHLSSINFEFNSESKTLGKLEATERHLQDMRNLVFNNK